MAITSYTGVLHTNTKDYFNTFTNLNKKNIERDSQINFLKAKEAAFYSQIFGVWTIEEFISKLKELFQDAENDSEAFRFFENSRVRSWLSSLDLSAADTIEKNPYTVNITYIGESGEIDFSQIFNGVGEGLELSSSGDSLKLVFGPDLASIKKAFNKHFKYKKSSNGDWVQTGTLLSSESTETAAIKKTLSSGKALRSYLIKNFTDTFQEIDWSKISIRVSNASTLTTILTDEKKINNPLFNDNNADLVKKAEGGNLTATRRIKYIRDTLKNKIYSESGMGKASDEMKIAFERTWANNVEANLSQIALFGREGALNYLVGSFGEFQTALLFEYVAQKAKGVPSLAPLISDTLKSGEQSKSDVSLMSSLGIQVKNYQPSDSSFEVNIHPQNFVGTEAFQSSGTDETGFLDTLANYFFNKTYRDQHGSDFQAMQDALPEYLAEIANMDVEQGWSDKVTFYFISGTYFVPASVLLEAQYARKAQKAQIDGKYKNWIDKEVLTGEEKPEGEDYWRRTKFGFWEYTDSNKSAYQNLVGSAISFRANMYYSSIKSGAYSLF